MDDFVRPVRSLARHTPCDSIVALGRSLAEDFAHDPRAMATMFCVHCNRERPVEEFSWADGQAVGS